MKVQIMSNNMLSALVSVAVLGAVCVAATPTSAGSLVERNGGSTYTYRGERGETFRVTREYNTGATKTEVDRNNGLGFQKFVKPAPAKALKPYSGSLYDPATDKTTTRTFTPGVGFTTTVEDGNTLAKH
jgi:hypothetical protein